MGWAERANPQSRRNRRQADGSLTPYRPVNVVQISKAQRVAFNAIRKFLARFRRAA